MTEGERAATVPNASAKFDVSAAGQWMAIGIAVAYVSGFVVVNVYFSKLGIRSFDLFRVQYLSAGGAIVFSLFIFYFFCAKYIDDFGEFKGGFKRRWTADGVTLPALELIAIVFATSMIAVGDVFASMMLSSAFFGITDPDDIRVFLILTGALFITVSAQIGSKGQKVSNWSVLLTLVLNIVIVVSYERTARGYHYGLWFVTVFMAMTLGVYAMARDASGDRTSLFRMPATWIAAFTGTTAAFSLAYAEIAPAYGGGRPDRVTIFLAREGVPDHLREQLLATGLESTEVDLLAETVGEIVVRPRRYPVLSTAPEPVVRLDRKLIVAISKR